MFKISKYRLKQYHEVIELPVFSEILCVKVENNDEIVLYAKVKTDETTMEKHTICMLRTGEEFEDEYNNNFIYIDTISIYDDTLIFHVFEYIE